MFIVQFCTFLYSPIPDNRNCDVHLQYLHKTQFIFGRYTLIMVSWIHFKYSIDRFITLHSVFHLVKTYAGSQSRMCRI